MDGDIELEKLYTWHDLIDEWNYQGNTRSSTVDREGGDRQDGGEWFLHRWSGPDKQNGAISWWGYGPEPYPTLRAAHACGKAWVDDELEGGEDA